MSGFGQPRRERVDLFAGRAVDDAGLARVARQHLEQLLLEDVAREHAIDEVRPVEGPDQLDRVLQRKLADDVAPDARGRRRRERVNADARDQLPQQRELPILGAKVVPPLADAVRFIDGNEADAAARQQAAERLAALADEPLR